MWNVGAIEPFRVGEESRAEFGGIQWLEGIGWLAFGMRADGHAGLWVSATGDEWIRADSPPPPNNMGFRVVDVAAGLIGGCARLVAVANLALRDAGQSWIVGDGSVALYSDDGLTWSLGSAIPSTSTWLGGVAAGEHGFVAAGPQSTWPTPSGERVDGRIWTSPDGEAWTEIAPPELVDSIPLGIDSMDGTLIATGFADRVSPPQMAWLSTDGTNWSGHEAVPPQSQGSIFEVAQAEVGLVVMAGVGPDGAYASVSHDGVVWDLEYFPDPFGDPTSLEIRAGTVVVAVFQGCIDCAPGRSLLWVRDPGATAWRSVHLIDHVPDDLAGAAFVGVAMNDSRTALVTADGTTIVITGPLP
jgi:hypothetical protein